MFLKRLFGKNVFWNSRFLVWLAGVISPVKPSPKIEIDCTDDPAYKALMVRKERANIA